MWRVRFHFEQTETRLDLHVTNDKSVEAKS